MTRMDARAAELIQQLRLVPHPEGGFYREVHRSSMHVQPSDARPSRAALTTIFFLLVGGGVGRWHRIASDEAWHHYEGAALDLFSADPAFMYVTHRVLGRLGAEVQPVHVVSAGEWQAAQSQGPYTLVGCTVAPGFEFADFQMLRDLPADAEVFKRRHGHMSAFV